LGNGAIQFDFKRLGHDAHVLVGIFFCKIVAHSFGHVVFPKLESLSLVTRVPADKPELALALIESILPIAAERGLEFCAIGFAADDSRLKALRNHFRCREYNTRLYRVRWKDTNNPILDGRPFLPELAFL
jgi:hypothetical protein